MLLAVPDAALWREPADVGLLCRACSCNRSSWSTKATVLLACMQWPQKPILMHLVGHRLSIWLGFLIE